MTSTRWRDSKSAGGWLPRSRSDLKPGESDNGFLYRPCIAFVFTISYSSPNSSAIMAAGFILTAPQKIIMETSLYEEWQPRMNKICFVSSCQGGPCPRTTFILALADPFGDMCLLIAHYRNNHRGMSVGCSICYNSFNTWRELKEHLNEKHDMRIPDSILKVAKFVEVGDHLSHGNEVFKVLDVKCCKVKRSGKTEYQITGAGIFTGKMHEFVFSSTTTCVLPQVISSLYKLIDISEDGELTLLSEGFGHVIAGLTVEDELMAKFVDGFVNSHDVVVTVTRAGAREEVTSVEVLEAIDYHVLSVTTESQLEVLDLNNLAKGV